MLKSIKSIGLDLLGRAKRFLEAVPAELRHARPLVRRLHAVTQFILLVVRGFNQNRCPIRAAALSYTTLLALIPLLAIMLSVSRNFLKETSAVVIPKVLDKVVLMVAPQLEHMPIEGEEAATPDQPVVSEDASQKVVEQIQGFLEKIDAGTLGTVGTIFLTLVGIRLLMTIEGTFNDIWGVEKGRSIWRRVVYYWTTITLGPVLLILAIAWTGRVEFSSVFGKLQFAAGLEKFLLHLFPLVLLWAGFTFIYALMPNTHVRLVPALVGGIVGGTLWQVNSLLSTIYISRVVTYSKIYGALGIIPIFLVGLYFSWLIVLFGAQVSFAMQNVRTYLQQRASERVDAQGRELVACRVVLLACSHFLQGMKPPSLEGLAERLGAPPQLLNQLVSRLVAGGVLAEIADEEGGLQPARPPASFTVADVLQVVRTSDGTCGEPTKPPGDEIVAQMIGDLRSAERSSPANLSFSDLAAKLPPQPTA